MTIEDYWVEAVLMGFDLDQGENHRMMVGDSLMAVELADFDSYRVGIHRMMAEHYLLV